MKFIVLDPLFITDGLIFMCPRNILTCFPLTSPDLVLLGCSNKTLHVYDMNVGKCATVFSDVHTRQPHIIRQNKVSMTLCIIFISPCG